MKTRSSKSVLMMALLLGSPAFADTTRVYSLDPAASILSERTTESQRLQTIRRAQSETLSVQPIANDSKWMKVERANGGSGYVQRSDLKEIEIRKTFVIRNDPSLNAARVANTSDVKKPLDLIVTGHKTTTVEKDASGKEKKIVWQQVVANGKKGWVAASALNTANEKAADGAKAPAAKTNPVGKPVQASKAADGKPGTVEKKAESKPAVAGKTTDPKNGKPGEGGWKTPPEKSVAAPQVDKAGEKPAKAADAPKAPEQKKVAEAKLEKPNAKTADAEECVRTQSDFKKSSRMATAFGAKNPFVTWEGAQGGSNMVVEGDSLTMLAGPMATQLKLPVAAKTPVQVCISDKNKPYLLMNKQKVMLSADLSQFENGMKVFGIYQSNTYTRKASVGASAAR